VKLTTHLYLVPRSKNEWSYTPLPNTPSWLCAQLKKKSTGTTFTFIFIIIIIIIIIITIIIVQIKFLNVFDDVCKQNDGRPLHQGTKFIYPWLESHMDN
jgi:hypothetical protein